MGISSDIVDQHVNLSMMSEEGSSSGTSTPEEDLEMKGKGTVYDYTREVLCTLFISFLGPHAGSDDDLLGKKKEVFIGINITFRMFCDISPVNQIS